MRIFLGCYDIASVLSGIAEGLKMAGHDVTSFVMERNLFYPTNNYDIVKEPFLESKIRYQEKKIHWRIKLKLQKVDSFFFRKQMKKITPRLIDEYDLFIFFWNPWINEQDLFPLIKAKGKRIICVQLGSDVRYVSAYKQEFGVEVNYWEKHFHLENLNEKIRKIRVQELFADSIFSVPDQAGLLIRGYHHIHIPLTNIEKIIFTIPDREVPIIIHAPSRTGLKGTAIIIKTIERLKSEGFVFEFRLIQNMPNEDLLKELTHADILIDQIFLHGPGVLGTEAMAAGTLVATRFFEEYKHIFNPPVVDIKPDNIYEKMKHILMNRAMYKELQLQGRDFVEKNNTPQKVAEKIMNSLSIKTTEYQPSFFIDKFLLNTEQKLSKEILRLNKEVIRKYSPLYTNSPSLIQRNLI